MDLAADAISRLKFARDKVRDKRIGVIQTPKRSIIAQLLVDPHFSIVLYKGEECLAERTYESAYKLGWPEGIVLKNPTVVRRATQQDIRNHPYFGAIYG